MRLRAARLLLLMLVGSAISPVTVAGENPVFAEHFENRAMRVDYYHAGRGGTDYFSIDRVYEEPHWGGNPRNLVDSMDLGKYQFRVYDFETGELLYSRGFSSIYGEWETTDEARADVMRTFHESAVFPYPKHSVRFAIAKRDEKGEFSELFETRVDPDATWINREDHGRGYEAKKHIHHGDPAEKVDIVIIGDGYTRGELSRFEDHVEHFTDVLFDVSPFRERREDFNVWTIAAESRDSGIDEPTKNLWRSTALGATYFSLNTPRYVLTTENRALRDIASNAPYDQIYIIFNSDRYGGGGIYNLFATCYTTPAKESEEWWPDYVFVHEFGHLFAGLGDEYYTSNVSYTEFYPEGVEPWEPNVTALLEGGELKWGDLVEEVTPVPTPWDKTAYDSLSTERRNLEKDSNTYEEDVARIDARRKALLDESRYGGSMGAFEGAGYAAEGLYRPFLDCRMFSKSVVPFCPVCERAIERMTDFHTK